MWSTRLPFLSCRFFRITPLRRLHRRTHSISGNGGGNRGGIKATVNDGGKGGWGSAIWVAYLRELNRRPVLTKMWTSGVINALGDILAQNFFETGERFRWKRLGVFTALGLLMVGPTLHVWYNALARFFVTPGFRSAVGSLMFDQFLFAPAFCAVILSTLAMTETHQVQKIWPKLEQDWAPTIVMNWKIWIPAQLVNFWIIPTNLRVLFANVVALAWTTYLSYASHKRVRSSH